MQYLRRQTIASLFALSFCPLLFALDLPLQLRWDSASISSYAPQQTDKEASWSEYYRVGIAIDSLSYKQASLSLLLQSHNDFISNAMELNELQLSYVIGNWQLSAESMPMGYGLQNTLNPYHLISPNQDSYLYQATRFNGLLLAHKGIYGRLGGNVHTQSIGSLGYGWQNKAQTLQLGLDLSARSMDSHWRSPLNISSANLAFSGAKLKLNLESALSYYWDFNRTDAHTGLFALAEASYALNKDAYLYLTANTTQVEPSSKSIQEYQLAWHYSLGKISLNPATALERRIDTSFYKASLAADYSFIHGQRVGLFYRAQGSSLHSVQHAIGFQAELTYGL